MHQYTSCRTDGHTQSLALALSALACKLGRWEWLALLASADPFYHTLLTFQCCILENHLWSPFSYFSSTDAVILEERDSHHYTHTRAKFILSPAAIRKLIVSKSPKLTRELQLFELNNSSQLQLRAVNFNMFRRAYLNLHGGGVFPGNSPWTSLAAVSWCITSWHDCLLTPYLHRLSASQTSDKKSGRSLSCGQATSSGQVTAVSLSEAKFQGPDKPDLIAMMAGN